MKKIVITLLVIDVITLLCFFIVYGPIKYPREFWITTSMKTMNHRYLAHIFYSDKTIFKVLNNNTISNFKENTDASEIKIGEYVSTSVYDKEILDHDPDELYKILNFKYNGYNVYLTAIYDPSRVSLVSSRYLGSYGELITTICNVNDGKVCINASGFSDEAGKGTGGSPTGTVIENGKIVWSSSSHTGGLIGFNKDNVLVLTNESATEAIKNGIVDAVEFGPFLIVNGKEATIKGNGGWGIQPRAAIGQRKDGIVLFLIVDGNNKGDLNYNGRGGVDLKALIEIFKKYGAYNAANLDGGASTSMAVGSTLYNKPLGSGPTGERKLPNAWIVK